MYVYMYVSMYVCVYMYVWMDVCMCGCVYVFMYVCNVCVCVSPTISLLPFCPPLYSTLITDPKMQTLPIWPPYTLSIS